MKLASLIDLHRQYSKEKASLADSFGDGFLCARNHLFKNLRAKSIALGFQFSTEQNDAYRALPLSQLDEVLSSKIIPYIDNVTVLEMIEKKIPRQTEWDDITDNLKGNSVFHESCHAYSRDVIRANAKGLDPALSLLLEESFANTCELLSILDADDPAHRLFLELNSYIYMLDDRVHLANAAKDIGPERLFRFMLLSYLHANFLRDSIDFDRTCKLALKSPPDAKTAKNLRQLSKIAFKMNPRFREVTTQFYLKLHRVPENFELDFLGAIEASAGARAFLQTVATVSL